MDNQRDRNRRHFRDPQTGQDWLLVPENKVDIVLASVSAIYLLVMLVFFLWLLVDTWTNKFALIQMFGEVDAARLNTPIFQLAVYAFIGGGLGGVVNGIRSILQWHSELRAFGSRFIWKYITLPGLGATLGLFVFALILGGTAVIAADITGDDASAKQILAVFGIGALAGFGSRSVFKWLDVQVTKIFKTTKETTAEKTVSVPSLVGMTKEKAESTLTASKLILGEVTEKPDADKTKPMVVIEQDPKAGVSVAGGSAVDVVIGNM